METVLKAIADWIKGILTAGIMSNLSGLFDAVNEQVGDIAQQVGTRPSAFEPRVFAMIESLSRNVVLPIAGIILTFIACYELIEMITQHNNMAQFEPALIMRWIFKTAVSVWFISNTFDIVMAVFDLTQKVVSDSSGIIAGNTRVNEIGLSMLEASLMQMDFQKRKFDKGMHRLTGKFKMIWKNQNGLCYHCGMPMDVTEEREIFYLAPKAKTGVEDVRNMRYVHCACQRIYAENRLKK